MTALETAIADVSLAPWSKADVDEDYRTVSIILNAVASGDLITREASDARAGALLREAAGFCTIHAARRKDEARQCPLHDVDIHLEAAGALNNVGKAIIALSPDATAALDRAVKAAREDALKDAECAVWFALKHSSSITSDLATSAIRAIAHEVGQ